MESHTEPRQDPRNRFQTILILSWSKPSNVIWDARLVLGAGRELPTRKSQMHSVLPGGYSREIPHIPLSSRSGPLSPPSREAGHVLGWTTNPAPEKHPPSEGLQVSSGPSASIRLMSLFRSYWAGCVPMTKRRINN